MRHHRTPVRKSWQLRPRLEWRFLVRAFRGAAAASLVTLAVGTVGCRVEPIGQAAMRANERRARTIPLAEIPVLPDIGRPVPPTAGCPPRDPAPAHARLRLLVTPEAVDVDAAALVASWGAEQPRAVLDALAARGVSVERFASQRVPATGPPGVAAGDPRDLPDLVAALDLVREVAAAAGRSYLGPSRSVTLHVHRDVSFALVRRVGLALSFHDVVAHLEFPVAGPAGPTSLAVEVPAGCRDEPMPAGPCLKPHVMVSRRGTSVVARIDDDIQRLCVSQLPSGPRSCSVWDSRELVTAATKCPSVPRLPTGALDDAGLEVLLRAATPLAPRCRFGWVGADDDVPWREVAATIATLQHLGVEVLPQLGLDPAPGNCSAAFVLPPLRPRQ